MNNLTAPFKSITWCEQFLNEQNRCCKEIDARLDSVRDESILITKELGKLEEQMKTTYGLFACIGLYFKIRKLQHRLNWHDRVMSKLYAARINRTMTW